jgi:hypothetical protein
MFCNILEYLGAIFLSFVLSLKRGSFSGQIILWPVLVRVSFAGEARVGLVVLTLGALPLAKLNANKAGTPSVKQRLPEIPNAREEERRGPASAISPAAVAATILHEPGARVAPWRGYSERSYYHDV